MKDFQAIHHSWYPARVGMAAVLLMIAIYTAGCTVGGLSYQEELARSEAYLAEASQKPGAQSTASGLIYRQLTEGTGPQPTAANTVQVNYRGALVDGTVFDSSSAPIEFPLRGVIPCWTEGVQLMRVGGKSELVCPASIAYGESGAPPNIPGGAALVFEVELLNISQ